MPTCCGCHASSDYGTSELTGDGSKESPYSYRQIDPEFIKPIARVVRTANLAIPNNTPTAVSWQASDFLTQVSMFNLVDDTRITLPVDGFYLMGLNSQWAQSSARRETYFRLNGITELNRHTAFNSSAVDHIFTHSHVWYFNALDYLEVVALQTSGGNLNLISSASTPSSFWVMYLGKKV